MVIHCQEYFYQHQPRLIYCLNYQLSSEQLIEGLYTLLIKHFSWSMMSLNPSKWLSEVVLTV